MRRVLVFVLVGLAAAALVTAGVAAAMGTNPVDAALGSLAIYGPVGGLAVYLLADNVRMRGEHRKEREAAWKAFAGVRDEVARGNEVLGRIYEILKERRP